MYSTSTVTSIGKPLLGGHWTLVDCDTGRAVTDASFRDKFSLLYFGFTHCPDICPNELVRIGDVLDKLEGENNPEVVPLFVTVDPNRDTIAQMKAYKGDFHPKFKMLTGTRDQVADITKAYCVYFSKADENEDDDEDYLVDHSIVMYLVGPDGHGRKRHLSRSRSRSRSRSSRRHRHTSSPSSVSSRHRHQSTSKSDFSSARETKSTHASPKVPLPALAHREELLEALTENQVVVCVGETGSGKTTQLPQYLHACGAYTSSKRDDTETAKCIAITQPRRVATVSVAQRVAEEMHTSVGGDGLVGYSIRFESRCSAQTKLKFLTDGVLVRECLSDPLLEKYSVVMLDEAHERSIHTDLLFGLLKQVMSRRPEFRVLITSATLDADRFADFFGEPTSSKKKQVKVKPCPVVKIPGRVFPVDIFHSKQRQIMGHRGPLSTYVRAAVETTMQVHNSEEPGHVLVFLTGQREIEDACGQIRALYREQERRSDRMELRVLPLYGALQGRKQREIFDAVPMDRVRKVIVATNIAETSLTIDGVRYVVDCGFTKQKVYNPVRQMESLVVVPISKVSAQQRAGRAGRTASGKCYRLYNKASYEEMAQETVPEIQRTNLANTVLYLKILGIQDVLGFQYLDPPDEDSLLDALKQLYVLGALDATGEATPLGKLMSAFPLEPKLSRAVVESLVLDCSHEMIQVVAMLSVENVFVEARHQGKKRQRSEREEDDELDWEHRMQQLKDDGLLHEDGDQLTYQLLLRAFEARSRQCEGHRRDLERWCDDRHLRLRALTMAGSIVKQLRDIIDSLPRRDLDAVKEIRKEQERRVDVSLDDRLRQALCAGFFMNAARRCTMETVYRLMHHEEGEAAQLVQFHPLSAMCYVAPPEFCVYQELVVTSKPFMRGALAVERRWLDQYSRNKLNISTAQLFALCGRKPPKEAMNEEKEAQKSFNKPEGTSSSSKPVEVTADAIAAARARFLARKKQ
ncbi:putative pre-mRNA-splicing factor ATP-dependent RNA helicase mog-5 [Phytophthora citrophthora]|uniref:RNA helicase n=1 Tax=Phytophthora citrophthora TaxID=4793 RepID=A0AAD9GPJ5_9STRA|nr:putative pre-mRNA-splicing factor ATP-dependent RNA helicase mog-5 [Phytophthora citrophthora]